jgi:PAS domain S-box-containing protein
MRTVLHKLQTFNIQTRLVVYYITFAILTLGVVVYLAYNQAVHSLEATVEDKLSVIASLKIDGLNRWVDEQQRNAVFLANLPEMRSLAGQLLNPNSSKEVRDIARWELTKLLTVIVQRTADFQDIQILDMNGTIAVSLIPRLDGVSQADQPFFTEGTSKTFTQPFYRSDQLEGITFTVSTPLFDNSYKRVGVLALHFNMKRVDEIVRENSAMNETVQSYLITADHQVITNDPILLANLKDPEIFAKLPVLTAKKGSSSYVNQNGVSVIGQYYWMEKNNAALIVELDRKSALWPAEQLALSIIITGAIFSVLLVIIVILMARRITAPLRALSQTVSRVSAGDLNASAPVLTDDEVGALAWAFNSMTDKLHHTLDGLQDELRVRKLAQEELLQFRKVMDESNDAIYMVDPQTGNYLDFNRRGYECLGYSREELAHKGVTDIDPYLRTIHDWRQQVRFVQEKGELIFETVNCRKDGTTFPAEVSARMLEYGGKTILVASVRDITERKLAEAALRESEERFRKVFESSPVAICITTLEEGRLLDANYAYWDLTGYNPNTAIGQDANQLKMWDDPEARLAFVKNLREKKSYFNSDDHFQRADGSFKYIISFYELIHIGTEDCILAMFYDMSVQKYTMQALQQSEARIRALLSAFPDMVIEITADGTVVHIVPPKGTEVWMAPELFIGKQIQEIFSETVARQTLFSIQRALESEQLNTFEFETQMGGVPRVMEARLVASPSTTVLMLIRDITQRKWVEAEREKLILELEEKNRESETLRESLESAVGTFEFSEIIQRILEQIKRVIPYDTASVWRVEGNQQFIISGVDLPPEIKIPGTVFTADDGNSAYPILKGEVPYILNNNVQEELADFQFEPHTYVQSWLAIPLKTRGKVIGLIALDGRKKDQFNSHHAALAVTFANQLAIALENARLFSDLQTELGVRKNLISELESKNAELERFTYTVSHDLKSPLFTIRGFLGFLEQDALNGNRERLTSDIQRITDATEKMNRLLNELLELSRIGRIKNESTSISFEKIVREAAELVYGQISERGIELQIEPNLPVVYGDYPRLVEVLQNLLDNAAKFMRNQKEPRIEVGQQGEADGNPVLYVRDNGMGIAPEHFDRVFGLFNKLDPKTDGTGIGLALVKRIIEVHGGKIWVESEVGEGTTFFFTLHKENRGLQHG